MHGLADETVLDLITRYGLDEVIGSVAIAVVNMRVPGIPRERDRALENIHQYLARAGQLATMHVPK